MTHYCKTNPFTCPYCRHLCEWVQDDSSDGEEYPETIWQCNYCPIKIEYRTWDDCLTYTNFIIDKIRGVIDHAKDSSYLRIKKNHNRLVFIPSIIIKFDCIPDWTPNNFKEKSSLYLLFS
jgi:hypothetical protein